MPQAVHAAVLVRRAHLGDERLDVGRVFDAVVAALRLTHDGQLRPCMDRGDLGYPLVAELHRRGVAGASEGLQDWLAQRVGAGGVR